MAEYLFGLKNQITRQKQQTKKGDAHTQACQIKKCTPPPRPPPAWRHSLHQSKNKHAELGTQAPIISANAAPASSDLSSQLYSQSSSSQSHAPSSSLRSSLAKRDAVAATREQKLALVCIAQALQAGVVFSAR